MRVLPLLVEDQEVAEIQAAKPPVRVRMVKATLARLVLPSVVEVVALDLSADFLVDQG